MRALAKLEPAPGLNLIETERPRAGIDEVVIRVGRMAVCGTDLHIYDWDEWARSTVPTPLVLGHEFMGTVAEVGDRVETFAVGDRVSAEGHITCGRCRNCRAGRRHLCRNTISVGIQRDGAFAEYVAVPAFNVYALPDHIDDDTAAVLDPLGNAVHTALTFDLVGEDVLITGAGPIGLMATAICQRAGARHIVVSDVTDTRLELAMVLGATRTVGTGRSDLVSVMTDLGMQEGFDVGLEMSGAPEALDAMVGVMNHGGRVALLGLIPGGASISWTDVIFKGLTLKGIYGRQMFDSWYKAAALLQEGLDLHPLFTHRYPATAYEAAFAAVRNKTAAKVLMAWDDES